MKKRPVLILVIVLVLIALVLALVNFSKIIPTSKPKLPKIAALKTVPQVLITSKGFLPQAIKIKKGEQIKWVNQDTSAHQIAADPYPNHASLPGLFSLALLSNDSYTFT